MTFMEDFHAGHAHAEDVDDHISLWRKLPGPFKPTVHEYLGMTWLQYENWRHTGKLDHKGQWMLTAAQQGILVVSALGKLPGLGDLLNPELPFVDGCCPAENCCPECSVLKELDQNGILDEVVTWAPNDMWSSMLWWRNGMVDRTWLYSIWDCQSRPRCHTDEYVDNLNLDYIAERLARQTKITVPEAYAKIQDWLTYEERFYAAPVNPALALR